MPYLLFFLLGLSLLSVESLVAQQGAGWKLDLNVANNDGAQAVLTLGLAEGGIGVART